MRRILGAALLVAGVILLVWGIDASDSFSSDVSRFFNDRPTNETMWLIVGGASAGIVGLGLLGYPGRKA